MVEYTIHGLHEKLVNKDISSVELTKKIIAHRNLVEGKCAGSNPGDPDLHDTSGEPDVQ